ncbi:hypothetical protein QBC36DRAFT_308334 [Triangularia setosa]|uniref:Uncharacterized protein n=1 Tax=Triangularia setosa TaxID=2587417 RepID=A0AAN6WDT3_9PEZI|nr:hypothetical protein QBC36DRAFT_308334 [Podospora setosa]
MCVTIQNAIDRIEDNEQKELARDTPYVIMELAEQHSESFYLKVVNSNANDRIMPANQILHRSLVVRCDISTGTPSIGSLIEEEYSRFANGAMADRITEVINQAIELLLNSFTDRTSNGEF